MKCLFFYFFLSLSFSESRQSDDVWSVLLDANLTAGDLGHKGGLQSVFGGRESYINVHTKLECACKAYLINYRKI